LVFDLPRSTSHELAVDLFDLPPIEKTLVKRKLRFLQSTARHVFPFVREGFKIDRRSLFGHTLSWHNNVVLLLQKVDGVSSLDFAAESELVRVNSLLLGGQDYGFFYIQECVDLDSLSFYRLFRDPEVLCSFRSFLESLTTEHRRLVILFSASLLRFRFCAVSCEYCPLCGKKCVWEHFFACPKMEVAPEASSRVVVLDTVRQHISDGQWDVFVHYLRFYLLQCSAVFTRVVFPTDVIESLC
jgi:hypothetical protein